MVAPSFLLVGLPQSGKSALLSALNSAPEAFGSLTELPGSETLALLAPTKSPDPLVNWDGLIITLDTSLPEEEFERTLQRWVDYLQQLCRHRAAQLAVAAWPVVIALTKCDTLTSARTDSPSETDRIAQRVAWVRHQLAALPLTGFGTVHWTVIPTSTRPLPHPTEAHVAGQPLGLTDLVRELTAAQQWHQQQQTQSTLRALTLAVGVGVLTGLMLLAGSLALLRHSNPPPGQLLPKLHAYQAAEPKSTSARLAEPRLERSLAFLLEVRNDPEFAQLPQPEREFVEARLRELEAYREFRDSFLFLRPPSEKRSESELKELEDRLNARPIPAEYANDWAQTDAVRRLEKWRSDAHLLRQAAQQVSDWYYDHLTRPGNELLSANTIDAAWKAKCTDLLAKERDLPFRESQRVPGTANIRLANESALTYASVFAFLPVEKSKAQWLKVRDDLETVRDLAEALGFFGTSSERAVLWVPETIPAPVEGFASQRLERLGRFYRHTWERWTAAPVPSGMRQRMEALLDQSRKHLRKLWHEMILRQLRQSAGAAETIDTPRAWQEVAHWLETAAELHPWREYTRLLTRLSDTPGRDVDPVRELVEFLRQPSFELRPTRIWVEINDHLRDQLLRPAPGEKLRLMLQPNHDDKALKTLTYRFEEQERLDRQTHRYRFEVDDPKSAQWTYRPGQDDLWMELLVREGTKQWQLSWTQCASRCYQFEKLHQPPMLHLLTQRASDGTAIAQGGVRVQVDGWPSVPELLPSVPRR